MLVAIMGRSLVGVLTTVTIDLLPSTTLIRTIVARGRLNMIAHYTLTLFLSSTLLLIIGDIKVTWQIEATYTEYDLIQLFKLINTSNSHSNMQPLKQT